MVNGAGLDDGRVVELSPEECQCQLPEPESVPALERMRFPVPVAPPPSWLERNMDRIRETTGLTGAALALYLIGRAASHLWKHDAPVRGSKPGRDV